MAVRTLQAQSEPLTFRNAPTVTRGGRDYLAHDAALELARRIATDDAELLTRLAGE